MSNSVFISSINDRIKGLTDKWAGSRVFGLAQSMIRDTSGGQELIPAMVDKEGEGKYIGFDDTAPMTIYHKANSITVTEKANTGYGNARSNIANTYANSMIVFMDRKVTGLLPDEFLLFVQANLADDIKVDNYKSVNLRIQNIILNSQQVLASEYQNTEYKIPPRFSLFAINYQIESVFDKSCFATCP